MTRPSACDSTTSWSEARFSVQIANDGAAALGILAQDPPDALVVGLRLPILDGRQVVHAARTVVGLVDMPIIVVAPAGSESETNDLLSQGVDDVLHEPIDPGKFRSRVTSVMRGRGLWAETEEVMRPLIPQDEAERLIEFRLSAAVDSEPEERFDKITRMAQRVFNVPFAAISFVEGERQWFKSRVGLPIADSSRDLSFCGHAITSDEVLVVEDAVLDPALRPEPDRARGSAHPLLRRAARSRGPGATTSARSASWTSCRANSAKRIWSPSATSARWWRRSSRPTPRKPGRRSWRLRTTLHGKLLRHRQPEDIVSTANDLRGSHGN